MFRIPHKPQKHESRCETVACEDLKMSHFRRCCMLVLTRVGPVCCRNDAPDVLKKGLMAMWLCSKRIWQGQISNQASGSPTGRRKVAETPSSIGKATELSCQTSRNLFVQGSSYLKERWVCAVTQQHSSVHPPLTPH